MTTENNFFEMEESSDEDYFDNQKETYARQGDLNVQ